MKKSAHSVLLVRGTGAGPDRGWGRRVWVSVWPRSWHYTPTLPLYLNCFKVLNRRGRRGKKKGKKKSGRLSHCTPCGESATDLQMGCRKTRQEKTDRAADGWEDVSQIGSVSPADAQTDRQSLLGERQTGRQAAGRRHWLVPRLHKQLWLWT